MNKKGKEKIPKPVILMVLDGWGVMQPYSGNAISQANTPNISEFIKTYPAMTLQASGEAVGLPWGEVGNSEVGHMSLGMGRILYQNLPLINRMIGDGSFYGNEKLLHATVHVKKNKSRLHLIGLLSNGGVHSHIDHLFALLEMAKKEKVKNVFVHVILDGRDTPYNSGLVFIKSLQEKIKKLGVGKIATISGRFYAMDRDNRWPRVEKAYLAMTKGQGNVSDDAIKALEDSYAKKIYDEEFVPTVIGKNSDGMVSDNDAIIFFNFRPDRAREITKAFVLPGFEKFDRPSALKDLLFVCFTEYEKSLPVEVAFYPEEKNNTLGQVISKAGFKQLRIAETEKYAHVTYFFNGGAEEKSVGEDHKLIQSPRVESYDMKPEMSAQEITEAVINEIDSDKYDFILINFANADMVAHTGNNDATIKAIETVDKCVGRVVKAALDKEGCVLITADHGNADIMFNIQTGTIEKDHTSNPVPLVIIGKQFEGRSIGLQDAPSGDLSLVQPQGMLSDVAPTILKIMDIETPPEMTGSSLI